MPELETVTKAPEKLVVTDSLIHESRKRRLEKEKQELEELEKEMLEGGPSVSGTDNEDEQSTEEEEDGQQKKLSKEEETFKKRYGDLRRHSQKKEEELRAEIERLKNGTNSAVRPPAKDEDIEAWASKYPDVARIVETIAQKKAKEMFASAEHRLEEYEIAQAESARAKATNKIRESHPDFDDISSSDEFHDWAEEQPKWVQDAVYENSDDPLSVIRVLDLYKVDKGMTPSARKQRDREAASNVSPKNRPSVDSDRQKGVFRESDVAKMSDRDFKKYSDAIDEAIRSGKFIYDLTK